MVQWSTAPQWHSFVKGEVGKTMTEIVHITTINLCKAQQTTETAREASVFFQLFSPLNRYQQTSHIFTWCHRSIIISLEQRLEMRDAEI